MKKHFSLIILILLYLVMSIHYYFPDDIGKTIGKNATHIFSTALFCIGFTILFVFMFKRLSGDSLSRGRIIRIYLTLAIIMEVLYWAYYQFSIK